MKRNLIENMDWRGEKDFSVLPFNEIDALILSVLIYQRFEDEENYGEGRTLPALYPVLCPLPVELTKGFETTRYRLWEKVASSKRFSSFKVDHFSFSLSSEEEEKEEQFAASILSCGDGKGYVIFRGTDESITGWKEDLNLGFEDEIPSERKALSFIEKYGRDYDSLILAGHSKGGTLALYAALKAVDDTFSRIETIYSFDAPGLASSLTDSPRWKDVLKKTQSFIPSSSIIGMLFNTAEKPRVVRSDSIGIMQHDAMTWCTDKETFTFEKDVSIISRLHSASMRSFLSSTTKKERETLVSVIYRVLSSVKEENVFRIPLVILFRLDLFNNELFSLTGEEKKVLRKLFKAFIASRREGFEALKDSTNGKKEK